MLKLLQKINIHSKFPVVRNNLFNNVVNNIIIRNIHSEDTNNYYNKGINTLSKTILSNLPESDNDKSLWPRIKEITQTRDPRRLIVLDDDLTGCQSVYNCNVLLDYSVESIKSQLLLNEKLFYIITNSRSLSENDCIKVTKEIVFNIQQAIKEIAYQHPIQFISRSDSNLRGHFPAETNAIADALNQTHGFSYDGTILLPAFFEGGRVTLNDVHYITDGDELIPAAETQAAKDINFGYKSSNLIDWIIEKSNGAISRDSIRSISLSDIRKGGPNVISEKLESAVHGAVIVVNAIHEHDLNTFIIGLLQAESNGYQFLYRTSASFVASRAGLENQGILNSIKLQDINSGLINNKEVNKDDNDLDVLDNIINENDFRTGGLTVVGSPMNKTSIQLASLFNDTDVVGVEIPAQIIVKASQGIRAQNVNYPFKLIKQIERITAAISIRIDSLLKDGLDVVLYTSREFVKDAGIEDARTISRVVTDVVGRIKTKPSFLIAKGGVTANDIAINSLKIKNARMIGQIEPGVPLWKTGENSKFPNMNYIVFPGNVGDDFALSRVAMILGVKKRNIDQETSLSSISSWMPLSLLTNSDRGFKLLDKMNNSKKNGNSLCSFSVYNIESAKAVILASEELKKSVILQVHSKILTYLGKPFLTMLDSYKKNSKVPVFIHLDHATDERQIMLALQCGIDSIMVDGSHLSFEENIKWTASMASLIHLEGVAVEAKLGKLNNNNNNIMTDPDQCKLFIKETRVDMLAVTIGDFSLESKTIDFDRLNLINEEIGYCLPLVLYDTTGISINNIKRAIDRGVCKINFNSELEFACNKNSNEYFMQNKKMDSLLHMQSNIETMKNTALNRIKLCSNII